MLTVIGLLIVGPCLALLTGRWLPAAATGAWACGLAVLLGLPDGIWATSTHLAFISATAIVAATAVAVGQAPACQDDDFALLRGEPGEGARLGRRGCGGHAASAKFGFRAVDPWSGTKLAESVSAAPGRTARPARQATTADARRGHPRHHPWVPHVFQGHHPILGEAAAALDRARQFLSAHLTGSQTARRPEQLREIKGVARFSFTREARSLATSWRRSLRQDRFPANFLASRAPSSPR